MNKANIFLLLLIFSAFFATIEASAVEDCISCHEVRHGFDNNTYCISCHTNYTIIEGEHPYISGSDELVYPYFIHTGFDWEGDNANESGLTPSRESCPFCHESGMTMSVTREEMRICEDCHLPDNPGPWQKDGLRPDIYRFIPIIYSHYSGAGNMNVPDQSGAGGGDTLSTCFGYNTETGEGTCHGVAAAMNSTSTDQNLAAHIYQTDNYRRSDPYHKDITIDHMPDTTDCMFCHLQNDQNVRLRWGNASLPSPSDCNITANSECWRCHVDGGGKPYDFHRIMVPEKGVPVWMIGAVAGFILIVVIFALSRMRKT